MSNIMSITQEAIQSQIFNIRGKQVMVDKDLALLFGIETKRLNEQVRRNPDRFPAEFMFELTKEEQESLRSQFATLKKRGTHNKYLTMVFTELGVVMLTAVLRSAAAISVSIQIARAFVDMRRFLKDNAEVFVRLEQVERKQLKADENFERIFNALDSNDLKPKQGIFYEGQVFDAYTFIADLIRTAKKSIVLIDNYVDDTVLRMFAKRNQNVSLSIFTKKDCILTLDLTKYQAQYGAIKVKEFKHAHDRFLILDGTTVYHVGASLKDLGKKWFAFSELGIPAADILNKL